MVVKGKSSTNVHVKDVMTPAARLMTVTPNHSVLEVMEMMNDNNFRHVPVVRFWLNSHLDLDVHVLTVADPDARKLRQSTHR